MRYIKNKKMKYIIIYSFFGILASQRGICDGHGHVLLMLELNCGRSIGSVRVSGWHRVDTRHVDVVPVPVSWVFSADAARLSRRSVQEPDVTNV